MEQTALTRGVMGDAEKAVNEVLAGYVDGAHVVAASYDSARDVVVLDIVFVQHHALELTNQTLEVADWRNRVQDGAREAGEQLREHIAGRVHTAEPEVEG